MLTIYAVASRYHWQYLMYILYNVVQMLIYISQDLPNAMCDQARQFREHMVRLSSLYYSLTPLPSSPHSSPLLHSLLSPPSLTPLPSFPHSSPLLPQSPPLLSSFQFSSTPLSYHHLPYSSPLHSSHILPIPSPPLPSLCFLHLSPVPLSPSTHRPLSFLLPFDLLLSTLMQSRLHLRCPSSQTNKYDGRAAGSFRPLH